MQYIFYKNNFYKEVSVSIPNKFNSFGINYEYLRKKIKENHSHGHNTKVDDSHINTIASDNMSARDFARFKLHSTSDVIE